MQPALPTFQMWLCAAVSRCPHLLAWVSLALLTATSSATRHSVSWIAPIPLHISLSPRPSKTLGELQVAPTPSGFSQEAGVPSFHSSALADSTCGPLTDSLARPAGIPLSIIVLLGGPGPSKSKGVIQRCATQSP